jgi:hypothetical protein
MHRLTSTVNYAHSAVIEAAEEAAMNHYNSASVLILFNSRHPAQHLPSGMLTKEQKLFIL